LSGSCAACRRATVDERVVRLAGRVRATRYATAAQRATNGLDRHAGLLCGSGDGRARLDELDGAGDC
jgi:hypothetical protein